MARRRKTVSLLTPNGAAEAAGVSLDTIQRAIKAGEFLHLYESKGKGGKVSATSLDPDEVAEWAAARAR